MKERPVLMSAPMVRAILEGRKTQTRRLVKPQPLPYLGLQKMWGTSPDGVPVGTPGLWRQVGPDYPDDADDDRRCPYGVAGERLYVRESWCVPRYHNTTRPSELPRVRKIWYVADGDNQPIWASKDIPDHARIRPGIHMPRWVSRITLEITDVRVERLRDITTRDAMDEGIPQTAGEAHALGLFDMTKEPGHEWDNRTSVENYARLWDQINGRGSWEENPWVWAISFRRV